MKQKSICKWKWDEQDEKIITSCNLVIYGRYYVGTNYCPVCGNEIKFREFKNEDKD